MVSRKPVPSPGRRGPDRLSPRFELEAVLASVVGVRARIPEDATTAATLGTERSGSGVCIHERGLVLTVSYLICEAEEIWLRTADGRVVPGHVLACDFESGLGLIQAHGELGCAPSEFGLAARLRVGARVWLAAAGGREAALSGVLVARREFAGYWEYWLEEALFVAPAHPHWGGAGLFDEDGHLVGMGLLFVETGEAARPDRMTMAVPVDLLPPILDDLVYRGRRRTPPVPWLGLHVAEMANGLVIAAVLPGSPAERAGLEVGDRIFEVAGVPVAELGDFLRQVRALGPAGTAVPLRILRDDARLTVEAISADRNDFLRRPDLH